MKSLTPPSLYHYRPSGCEEARGGGGGAETNDGGGSSNLDETLAASSFTPRIAQNVNIAIKTGNRNT